MHSEGVVSAHDVAAYILQKQGVSPHTKIHRLLYYSQVWSLLWDQRPLFHEAVEAWFSGPIVRPVFEAHVGRYELSEWPQGEALKLDPLACETVGAVLKHYGDKPPHWLGDLARSEAPWLQARVGMGTERGNSVISHESMLEYYGALVLR